jgi:hypothetical protein
MSSLRTLLCISFFCLRLAHACECDRPGPACSLISDSHVVFLGTPVFTDDDGSGTFTQRTLYRFDVSEAYKGLKQGTTEVWIDPGSFTSCYTEYAIGKKYLVFASDVNATLRQAVAVSVVPGTKTKPIPPGFTPDAPLYFAAQYSGTRPFAGSDEQVEFLRAWKAGATKTRIYGRVIEDRDNGGVYLDNEQPLKGARVVLRGNNRVRVTVSDQNGDWAFETAEPASYVASAGVPGYSLAYPVEMHVKPNACGYAELRMRCNGSVSGTLVDKNGQPVAGVEVQAARITSKKTIEHLAGARADSKPDGSFRITHLPSGNHVVGVNVSTLPETDTPYPVTFAPGTSELPNAQSVQLRPGGTQKNVRLQLPDKLSIRTIEVYVKWPDGRPAVGAYVFATKKGDNGQRDAIEMVETDASGRARLSVIAGMDYTIKSNFFVPAEEHVQWIDRKIALSNRMNLAAGTSPQRIELELIRTVRNGDDRDYE